MPCWRIIFSTFPGCMSFHTAWVIRDRAIQRLRWPMSALTPIATRNVAAPRMTLSADFVAKVGAGKSGATASMYCERVLRPLLLAGAFEAVALTTATLTQHKQRRLVV